jgi:hypothetical protein
MNVVMTRNLNLLMILQTNKILKARSLNLNYLKFGSDIFMNTASSR